MKAVKLKKIENNAAARRLNQPGLGRHRGNDRG
jgi:hypothetical protein